MTDLGFSTHELILERFEIGERVRGVLVSLPAIFGEGFAEDLPEQECCETYLREACS